MTPFSGGHTLPHEEGLDAQPGRDESSPSPSAGLTQALSLSPERGAGKGERETLGPGLEDGIEGQVRVQMEQGRAGSREGEEGRVWGQAQLFPTCDK